MKLQLASAAGLHLFSGYGAGYVSVGNARYERCVLVTPQAVVSWQVQGFDALTPDDFAFVADLKPEIVILGTGARLRFPGPALRRALAPSGVGVEAMDTGAACRTYNILAQEGRKVVAAIVVE